MGNSLEQEIKELVKRMDDLEWQVQDQKQKNKATMFRIRNFQEFKKIIEIVESQIQSLQQSLKILKDYEFEIENVTLKPTSLGKKES